MQSGHVATANNEMVLFEWHNITQNNLNFSHLVSGTLTFSDPPNWSEQLSLERDDLIINASLVTLLTIYQLWCTNGL